MSTTEKEVAVRRVTVNLCELCIAGNGGECHVPGCILCRNRAPDLPLMPKLMEEVPLSETARSIAASGWRNLPTDRRQRVLEHLDYEVGLHERSAVTYEARGMLPAWGPAAETARQRAADLAAARRALS